MQYTGRENDGTGLYYYRARYYDPVLKRFISEDPIGIDGGLNLAAYVGGNPISLVDPSGNGPVAVGIGIAGACVAAWALYKVGTGAYSATTNLQNALQAQQTLNQELSNAANNPSQFNANQAMQARGQLLQGAAGFGQGAAQAVNPIANRARAGK